MARLDVRLDPERRRRLEEIAEEKGAPISEVVRSLIDDAYQSITQERRIQAVKRLVSMRVENTPEAAQLSLELEEAHGPGSLH